MMVDLVMSYVTTCLILYLSFHISNIWAVKLQTIEELHYKNIISKIHPLCSNLVCEQKACKLKLDP